MRRLLTRLFAAATLAGGAAAAEAAPADAYAFAFTSIDGGPLPLAEFRGKVLLVVNTASQCGFTGQYAGLQELWERYKDRGLVVLGVPSNDFGGQEPGSAAEIKQFCATSFDVSFPMTDKVAVTGAQAHPFYKWAAETLGWSAKPRWNFHKYLIDAEGRLVEAFSTVTPPTAQKVIAAVESRLPKP